MSHRTVFINGRVVSNVDDIQSDTGYEECMIVCGSQIEHIGTRDDEKVQAARSDVADRLDLKGRPVLPAFIDSHAHLLFFGMAQNRADLSDCTSVSAIRKKISQFAKQHPDAPRILCRGWDRSVTKDNALTTTLDDLDERPIFIDASDLHSNWCNTAALTELPMEEIKTKCGDYISFNEHGEASGVLSEGAVTAYIWPHLIKSMTMEERVDALENAINLYTEQGYTGAIDMAMEVNVWKALEILRATKGIPIHIAAHWFVPYEAGHERMASHVEEAIAMHEEWHPSKSPDFCVVGAKLFCDGVVDGCTAALSYPYGEENNLFQPLWAAETMNMVVDQLTRAGLQCAFHAIGDAAVTRCIDAIAATGKADARHRIEHLELASLEDAKRLGALGITASIQPVHSDPVKSGAYAKLIDHEQWEIAFPYKECIEGGAVLALGSDAPTSQHLPFPNLYNAIKRKSALSSWSMEQVNPKSALTLPQALKAATYGAAYSRFAESWTGTLKEGMQADFVVLDSTLSEDTLLKTKVAETWSKGVRVYKRDETVTNGVMSMVNKIKDYVVGQ